MVRDSLRYASRKHFWGQITRAMRAIYTAPTAAAAEAEFETFRDGWAAAYPAMIRTWGEQLGRVRAVPEVPRRAAARRQHHQRRREPQRPVPPSRAASRTFLNEQAGIEVLYPCRHHQTKEPREPHWQDQRLEGHLEHPNRALTATASPATSDDNQHGRIHKVSDSPSNGGDGEGVGACPVVVALHGYVVVACVFRLPGDERRCRLVVVVVECQLERVVVIERRRGVG